MADAIMDRIANFRKMAEADPTNDMAHFSLGNALLQAGQHVEAANALARCIELNPEFSKAYLLAGQAYQQAGDREKAKAILTKGYEVAARKGDRMPRDSMGDLLKAMGAPLPTVGGGAGGESEPVAVTSRDTDLTSRDREGAGTGSGIATPSTAFTCHASGRPGTRMEKPPFKGRLGLKIQECISQESWKAWIGQGTKVINEMRLDLSRDDHQQTYDEQMLEFLNLADWWGEEKEKKG